MEIPTYLFVSFCVVVAQNIIQIEDLNGELLEGYWFRGVRKFDKIMNLLHRLG